MIDAPPADRIEQDPRLRQCGFAGRGLLNQFRARWFDAADEVADQT